MDNLLRRGAGFKKPVIRAKFLKLSSSKHCIIFDFCDVMKRPFIDDAVTYSSSSKEKLKKTAEEFVELINCHLDWR